MDGGHQAETVEPAVDGAKRPRLGPKDPVPFDQGGDREGHNCRANQQIGHGQVDQEQVGPGSHPTVSNNHGQYHGIPYHGKESGQRFNRRQHH